jgi:Protein of unknown function (DUF2950)
MPAVGAMPFIDRSRISGLLTVAALWGGIPATATGQNPPPPPAVSAATKSGQTPFPTPQTAVQALAIALANDDTAKLLDMFGHDHAALVLGADPASGRVMRRHAAEALRQKVTMRHEGADKVVLVASNGWPMPIPLVRRGEGWVFDTAAGEQEILARRIGEDELSAIATLHALVDAQRRYAAAHERTGQPPQYAQYIQSTPGETDGLWWDAATAAKAGPSPLASFTSANQAFLEGRQPGDPFRGYYFRTLAAQGPHAPGGARGYLQPDGKMTGGFAMIAWPAAWRESGVMTFLVGPDGKVLQQDFGPDTQSVVNGIRAYDPGPGWIPAESELKSAHQ